ncbi:MAG TPA: hypothetical protein VFQ25_14360 [Ktedonobacterales bacterium]|nr:hypothetical protein [Ktedonobacterales bacterium]
MRERVWIHNPAMNLLAPEHLARIRDALAKGPIFGYWYRAHSGSGPNEWMARDFAEFERVIAEAKLADYYVVWSLPALLEKGVSLAAARYDDQPQHGASLLPAGQMRLVERYLSDPTHEYFGMFFGADKPPEVWTDDADGLESVTEYAEWFNKPGGEGYVFPFHSDWEKTGPDGFLISTPERPTIERPEYWLLEARYPNEAGEALEKHA